MSSCLKQESFYKPTPTLQFCSHRYIETLLLQRKPLKSMNTGFGFLLPRAGCIWRGLWCPLRCPRALHQGRGSTAPRFSFWRISGKNDPASDIFTSPSCGGHRLRSRLGARTRHHPIQKHKCEIGRWVVPGDAHPAKGQTVTRTPGRGTNCDTDLRTQCPFSIKHPDSPQQPFRRDLTNGEKAPRIKTDQFLL